MPISVPSLRRFLIIAWLGVCLFTTACVTPPVNTPAQPQPTCISSATESNPYLTHSQEGAVNLYQNYTAGGITFENARQEALSRLGKNTEHWSDHVDIAINENNMVRIAITYLDPVLIQYVVLNDALATYPPMGLVDFDNELRTRLNKLGERNEMLFVVTITTPNYMQQALNSNVLTVRIPIETLTLVSASDIRVTPTHEDHILDELIDISHGPVSGIVGYPFAVMGETQCIWIIDQWSNTLTLDVPSVILGGIDVGAQFWSIPYSPLVMEVDTNPMATFDPFYDSTRLRKIETPPPPTWRPNAQVDDTNWTVYWEDMGRYIWNLVITESHH